MHALTGMGCHGSRSLPDCSIPARWMRSDAAVAGDVTSTACCKCRTSYGAQTNTNHIKNVRGKESPKTGFEQTLTARFRHPLPARASVTGFVLLFDRCRQRVGRAACQLGVSSLRQILTSGSSSRRRAASKLSRAVICHQGNHDG